MLEVTCCLCYPLQAPRTRARGRHQRLTDRSCRVHLTMKPPSLVFIRVDAKYGLSRVHTSMCMLQLQGGGGVLSQVCPEPPVSNPKHAVSTLVQCKNGDCPLSKCPQANRMLMGFCTCGRYIWPTREGCKCKHTFRTSNSLRVQRCLNSVRIRTVIQDVSQGTRKSLKSLKSLLTMYL